MRQYERQLKETKEVKKIVCNKCGKTVMSEHGMPTEEMYSADYRWGYFSGKDGERHRFDLCETCYDELLQSFLIPAEINE